MKAGNIKGALLEYLVRNLFQSCGFTDVKADGLYTYEHGGIFYVNGRGAAHDADVIVNPPIQMPFAYPTQLIFECKAYGPTAGLTIVRNAFGLRNDLNEFEIVTKDFLNARKNNKRTISATEERRRFFFQVGVASINDFSKPATEFALNNRIPLLSLSWFLDKITINNFNNIDQTLIDSFAPADIENLYQFLKDRNGNMYDEKYETTYRFLSLDNILGDIITITNTIFKRLMFVALLETGDLLFLYLRTGIESFIQNRNSQRLKARIRWSPDNNKVWSLSALNSTNEELFRFDFFVPTRIFKLWEESNLSSTSALNIKQQVFSRIFIFNKDNDSNLPFTAISIDNAWLDGLLQLEIEQQG